jgi:hypothetical protein
MCLLDFRGLAGLASLTVIYIIYRIIFNNRYTTINIILYILFLRVADGNPIIKSKDIFYYNRSD